MKERNPERRIRELLALRERLRGRARVPSADLRQLHQSLRGLGSASKVLRIPRQAVRREGDQEFCSNSEIVWRLDAAIFLWRRRLA